MKSELQVIPQSQLSLISGGHGWGDYVWIGIAIELPHAFIGLREFINYTGGLVVNGCGNIEPDDYFTSGLCYPFKD